MSETHVLTVGKKAAQVARSVPLTRRFKMGYGAGAMADGIVSAGFGFFLLFYLTAVCGMSGTMAGRKLASTTTR